MGKHKIVRDCSKWPVKICSHNAGAIGELLVSADLLSRGYTVFRSVSPAAACDLIVLEDKNGVNAIIRFEVKTVGEHSDGRLYLCKPSFIRADVYVAVRKTGQIGYEGMTALGIAWLERSTVPFKIVRLKGIRGRFESRLKTP